MAEETFHEEKIKTALIAYNKPKSILKINVPRKRIQSVLFGFHESVALKK